MQENSTYVMVIYLFFSLSLSLLWTICDPYMRGAHRCLFLSVLQCVGIDLFIVIVSEHQINDTTRLLGQRRRTQELCMHWRSWTKSSSPKKIKQLMWSWNALCLINWIILASCGYFLHFKILFHCVGILSVICS